MTDENSRANHYRLASGIADKKTGSPDGLPVFSFNALALFWQ